MSEMATHNQTQVFEYLHSLNVDDLPSGDHMLSFAVATNAIGQWQQLPVRVFKGRSEGKKS